MGGEYPGEYRFVACAYRCLNWFLAIMLLLLCSQTAPNSFVFQDLGGNGTGDDGQSWTN